MASLPSVHHSLVNQTNVKNKNPQTNTVIHIVMHFLNTVSKTKELSTKMEELYSC